MGFKRVWDSSCPHVWDTWEADGKTWVIQDLLPEDDEKALQILLYHLAADEPLTQYNDVLNDPESFENMCDIWRKCLAERTSLACYMVEDGRKTLVALNCCMVICKDEEVQLEIKGKGWKSVYDVMMLLEKKGDAFNYLGTDRLLTALGLVVRREYRGKRLGGKLLAAREQLCKHLGVKGTETVFTSVAAQKLAAQCGFVTVVEMTWSDLADAGLDYPREDKSCKFMVKKY